MKVPGLSSDETVEGQYVTVGERGDHTFLLAIMPTDAGIVAEPLATFSCEDIAGNRIRVLVDRPNRDIWRPGQSPKPPRSAEAPLLWGYVNPSMQPRESP